MSALTTILHLRLGYHLQECTIKPDILRQLADKLIYLCHLHAPITSPTFIHLSDKDQAASDRPITLPFDRRISDT